MSAYPPPNTHVFPRFVRISAPPLPVALRSPAAAAQRRAAWMYPGVSLLPDEFLEHADRGRQVGDDRRRPGIGQQPGGERGLYE
ncbi:hypothetical protein GCM10011588_06300 [Nocardia jinanensis]|uniref:Uncharacterized protein n=1 Tax=Nocardia jinanensis TaxID=382504 RepID=A0A917R8J9_9NOCA|nr:hypothetical protein GCM10011588_06300 [Nocardia jinanensis]